MESSRSRITVHIEVIYFWWFLTVTGPCKYWWIRNIFCIKFLSKFCETIGSRWTIYIKIIYRWSIFWCTSKGKDGWILFVIRFIQSRKCFESITRIRLSNIKKISRFYWDKSKNRRIGFILRLSRWSKLCKTFTVQVCKEVCCWGRITFAIPSKVWII